MMRVPVPVPESPEPAVGSRSREPGTHMRSGFLGTEPETDTPIRGVEKTRAPPLNKTLNNAPSLNIHP
jgi:hypothetical protein